MYLFELEFFFGYMPGSRIAESCGNSSFWRTLHTIFRSDSTNLHSRQHARSLQHLLLLDFLMMAILTGERCYPLWFWFVFLWQLAILSIFFMCLLAICMSTLGKCLFRCLPIFRLSFLWLDFIILSILCDDTKKVSYTNQRET